MNTKSSLFMRLLSAAFLMLFVHYTHAQAIDPARSAKAGVINDARIVTANIQANKDMLYLARKAMERGTEPRLKELAEEMAADHSSMLYSLEQLAAAGTGASNQTTTNADGNGDKKPRPGVLVNEKISRVSGARFDSIWVAETLSMQQAKFDELTQESATVTNPQLKTAVTESTKFLRKHLSKLRSLDKHLTRMATQKRREEAMLKSTK